LKTGQFATDSHLLRAHAEQLNDGAYQHDDPGRHAVAQQRNAEQRVR
jgi:hypothetical protein